MPLNPNLIMPMALGLSLVSVTAFVVYYIFKKDEDETDERSIKTSRVNVIEIQVSKSIVPALIGRSGSNIKDIEKKSGALIHFKKFSDKDYDVCIIRGRSQATQLAETIIQDFLNQQPLIVEDTMTVPGWACGRIIGSGGESITEISHRSGARVKVEGSRTGPESRKVSIRGTREQIALAKELIDNCVSQEVCRREIEQSKRSPRHSQPTATDNVAPQPEPITKPTYKRPESSGSSIEVMVSAVSSPSRFWVQLVGSQVPQLDELVETMTQYYNCKENREAHALREVCVGQVVAAVFRHDGRWYRARVTDIRPNEFDATQQVADVFYVDYGDSEYVATHELCELRADLLRLRFQAMECFLAGVRPTGNEDETVGVTPTGQRWDKWHPQAVERFEELTQVARWKPLVSKTCTYKKAATVEGEKEREIPGIKLYDVTKEGELDIGATLVAEGWAEPAAVGARASLSPKNPPFGDLGNSSVLGMLNSDNTRASSMPKDHKDDRSIHNGHEEKENEGITSAKSVGSGLENSPQSISNFDLTYPKAEKHTNGSHDDFLHKERLHEGESSQSTETLVNSPMHPKTSMDELKANMNRIDSHHNLEALGRHQDLH